MKFNFKMKFDLVNGILFLRNRSWIFTIILFGVIFGTAVFVWVQCVFNPKPSEGAVDNIIKIEKEYQLKIREIKKGHQFLLGRIDNFNEPDRQLKERRYFEPLDLDKFSFFNKIQTGGSEFESVR